MRSTNVILSRKNWHLKMICGLMTILVICLSNLSVTSAARSVNKSTVEILEESLDPEDILANISDFDQLQEDASDQISNLLNPTKETFSINSIEYSEMSNAILNELYTNWISNPTGYSFVEQEVLGWDITNIQTPEQAVSIHETTSTDGRKTTLTTIYSERPYIKILDSGDSFIDDITVPVLSEPAGSGAYVPEYEKITRRINFGWVLPSAHLDKSFYYTFWGGKEDELSAETPFGARLKVWAKFDFEFHLFFPVDVTICYPTRIFEGQSYEFNCTVVPINDPAMEEFKFLIDAEAGWNVKVGAWLAPEIPPICPRGGGLYCHDTCCSQTCLFKGTWAEVCFPEVCWCCDYRWHCAGEDEIWAQLMGNKWSLKDALGKGKRYTALSGDYKTPLGIDPVSLTLPIDIDILEIIGKYYPPVSVLAAFLSLELGLGTANIYGDAVRAKMSILSEGEEDRQVAFTDEDGETARMKFTIPDREQTPNVEFSVTQFDYDFKKIEFNPYLYFGFDDLVLDPPPNPDLPFPLNLIDLPRITIPLRQDWGGFTYYFPKFDIPAEASIGSKFTHYSDGISVTEDYSAIYDFTMDVKDWYSGYTPYGYIQRYLIDLSNPNLEDQQNDVIKLSVSGLPVGYEADFDAPRGEYRLSGVPPTLEEQVPQSVWSDEYPKWAVNTVYSPFGVAGINRALLTISKTSPTDAPPGDWTFDIIANSTQRVNYNLLDPAISKNATLKVFEFHGIDLQLVDTLYNEMSVIPGEYFPIDFFGQNLGNVNDTVNVSASLDLGNSEKKWNEIFTLEPYGSTTNQYFSGQFGFIYDRTDLFPSPGVYLLELTANSSRTALIDIKLMLFLNFTKAYGVESSISPITTAIFANWEQNFTLRFNNTGNVWDNFTIESSGWDDYLTYPQRITDVSPMIPQEVKISLSIPNPGTVINDTYQFRIILKSEGSINLTAFSVHEVYVTILEPDYVPPGIVQVFEAGTYAVEYPQSPLTFGPSWKAYDEWNNTYTIYINGTVYETGGWTEGTPIQAPVTGINPLPPGIYNVTITFSDLSNNIASVQTWVKVVPLDTVVPLIIPIPGKTVFPVNFPQPLSFYWNCTEEYVYSFQILVNGTPVNLTWQYNLCMKFNRYIHTNFRFNYTIHPQTLSEGTWNITFVLKDMSNNIASDSVFITIAGPDSTQPNIINDPISSANLGYGTEFQIIAEDAFPDKYTLWVGTTLLSSGAWESGVPLIFKVDDIGIMVGDNDLKIDLIDLADNLASYQWTFSLSDIDIPTLLAAPPNLILYEHNYTRLMPPFWSVKDLDSQPGTFTINLDEVTIAQGVWSNANGILELPIPYLVPGTHHYDAYFRDASGNTVYSRVDLTLYDITSPAILAVDNIRFEPLYSADWFEFYISELHPAQFSLYRNATLVNSDPLTTGFPYVLVRIIDLSTGIYNYTMVVEDESGNIGHLSIRVQVTDYTPPLIVRPFDMVISEGAPDQAITWEIREANPQNYSLYRNGVLLESGTLTESILIHSLAGLVVGEYTYILMVFDTLGQSHTSTSYVTVLDMTPPILSRISDCRFVKNDPNADIVWQAYDLHPSSYIFTINGEEASPVSWDGTEITLHCTGWSEGNYTVLLQVSDTSGNFVSDEIKVEIFLDESRLVKPTSSPGFGLIGIILVLFFSIGISRRKKKPGA